MSVSSFIPNGRTSRVKKGGSSLQVQTEYALRPYPRLTTTILNHGQVLHKIEKKLDRPIGSTEEQSEIEQMIKRQHAEVVAIIKEHSEARPAMLQVLKSSHSDYLTLSDRIKAIPGVQKIFELDNEGNFLQHDNAEHFRRAYAIAYKGLRDLIRVFAQVPGLAMTREKGVLEVERDRLYVVSCGDEICVVTVKRANDSIAYEQALRKALDDFFGDA